MASLTFDDVLARDAGRLVGSAGREFVEAVTYWGGDEDPEEDEGAEVYGRVFRVGPVERVVGERGRSTFQEVVVVVTVADLAAVDGEGILSVGGERYRIVGVGPGPGYSTWEIRGRLLEMDSFGKDVFVE